MPGRTGAVTLLETCASADAAVRARVLEALARIPFDRDAWLTIGPVALAVADAAPGDGGRPELLAALAALPLRSARRRLEEIAGDPADPDRAVAARLIASPEQRARDEIAELVDRLRAAPASEVVERLACLPIEAHAVDPGLFEGAAASESVDDRVWAAIALARLGRLEALDAVFADLLAGDIPTFMWGSPWAAHDHLARACPLPDGARERLRALAGRHPTSDRDPNLFVWALTGDRDAEGNPVPSDDDDRDDDRDDEDDDDEDDDDEDDDDRDDDDRDDEDDRDDAVRKLLRPNSLRKLEALAEWHRALAGVDPEQAGRIVSHLVHQLLARRDDRWTPAGNLVMTIVEALPPGYRLDVADLLRSSLATRPSRMDPGQLCFAIARADLDAVLDGFAHLLAPDRPAPLADRTEAILDLLDGVAAMCSAPAGPRIGAGPSTPGRFLTGHRPLVDDLEEMVGAEPDEESEPDEPRMAEPEAPPDPDRPAVANGGQGREERQERAVRVDVLLPADGGGEAQPVSQSFVAGRRHEVLVWIGHQRDARPTTIAGATAFDEAAVTPDPGRFTELEVTLAHGDRVETKPLYLPNDRSRSSQPCEFDLLVRADQRIVSATVVIRQQQRVLEQYVLLGAAGPAPDTSPLGPITLERQVVARSPEQPGPPSSFDATVVRPRGDAPHVLLEAGTATVVSPWDEGVRETVRIVASRLYDTARALAAGETGDAWHALLRLLAAQGTRLHSWLEGNGYAGLGHGDRIQLLDADPTEPLPIEIVYDRGGVADDAVPCPGWADALARGTCGRCPPGRVERSPHICPLGFWGLSKVIERQSGAGEAPPLGRLQPLTRVLFAASGEGVLDEDYERTLAALEEVLGAAPATTETWQEWRQLVERDAPTLIVVLPHQDRDPALEVDFLEIGRASRLRAGEVRTELVKRAGGPDPVVLLLGCRTADASVSFQNFVAEFRSSGAAIVVGTLATVLGQDAAPIAQEFVRELATPSAGAPAGEPVGFGETMRLVRRRMVAEGNAAALGLVAFGDSDWLVEVPT